MAVGDLFPKVTLTGRARLFRAHLRRFRPERGAVLLGWAEHFLGGFDLGRVRARIGSAKAQTDAALAAYEGAVLSALEDTEGALISYGRSQVAARGPASGGGGERQGGGLGAQAL